MILMLYFRKCKCYFTTEVEPLDDELYQHIVYLTDLIIQGLVIVYNSLDLDK